MIPKPTEADLRRDLEFDYTHVSTISEQHRSNAHDAALSAIRRAVHAEAKCAELAKEIARLKFICGEDQ